MRSDRADEAVVSSVSKFATDPETDIRVTHIDRGFSQRTQSFRTRGHSRRTGRSIIAVGAGRTEDCLCAMPGPFGTEEQFAKHWCMNLRFLTRLQNEFATSLRRSVSRSPRCHQRIWSTAMTWMLGTMRFAR